MTDEENARLIALMESAHQLSTDFQDWAVRDGRLIPISTPARANRPRGRPGRKLTAAHQAAIDAFDGLTPSTVVADRVGLSHAVVMNLWRERGLSRAGGR